MHQTTVDEIKAKANLAEVIEDFYTLSKAGSSYYTTCPKCDKTGKGKGLSINKTKGLCKCFSCGWGTKSAISFLTETQNMSYPEALEYLAKKYQILDIDLYKKKKLSKIKKSFLDKQLRESGLTKKDILAIIPVEEGQVKEIETFVSATKNEYGKVVDGDDMVIYYYDLDGKQMTYQRKNNDKQMPFYRIRWAIPDQHKDKNGAPMKYQSPYGAGTRLYIPQFVRKAYQNGAKIHTLFLQEGEKKSEKACKHMIPSVGLSGINALGQKGKLPYELQLIVKRCSVERVVFIFDSDWKDISSKLIDGVSADQRPRNFYYAAKNFRDYFSTFTNMGIYLELYIAGIQSDKDKGLDDLLANTLNKKEGEFIIDIEAALNEKDGQGKFVDCLKVSDIPDLKLREFWNLHDAQKFADTYKDKLLDLKVFTINKIKWRFKNGKLEMAQPLLNNEQFYEKQNKTNRNGDDVSTYHFRYMYAYTFLRNRGFGRIEMANGQYKLARMKNKVVEIVDSYKIKDFAVNFALNATENHERVDVMDMLYKGAKMYLGPDSLGNLDYIYPHFEESSNHTQNLYFLKEFWSIDAHCIVTKDYSELENSIWKDKIREFSAKRTEPLFTITKITEELLNKNKMPNMKQFIGNFTVEPSKLGADCHFAKYLWNTGDFYWEKHKDKTPDKDERTFEEKSETALHFVSKMSALGYLLHSHFDAATPKAIIGMDGKLSEVGKSNGGSGKSIFGDAIGQVVPQVAIGAKNKKLTEDQFIFEEVNEKTDNVFLDDVRVNLDFEFLFPYITGKFLVNAKGQNKFTIPQNITPKIYISTNHAVNGEGSSFRRRQFMIPFSDYYNDKCSPRDEFGVNFFTEWDYNQKNLFFNFMAECLQTYLRFGLVKPPLERLELRRLRQSIGEDMIFWADQYYMYNDQTMKFQTEANEKLGIRISRAELYADFTSELPNRSKGFWTARKFGSSFREYCRFRGARFNPGKIDPASDDIIGLSDKSSGKEYFTIGVDYD